MRLRILLPKVNPEAIEVPSNTDALIDKYQPLVESSADGSLQAIGVSRNRRRQPT